MMVPPTESSGSSPGALTTVALTRDGRAALEGYTAVLRQLLDTADPAQPQASTQPEPGTDSAGSYASNNHGGGRS